MKKLKGLLLCIFVIDYFSSVTAIGNNESKHGMKNFSSAAIVLRFVAANVVRIERLASEQKLLPTVDTSGRSLFYVNTSGDDVSVAVRLRLADDSRCNRNKSIADCVITASEPCDVWNITQSREYRVCTGSVDLDIGRDVINQRSRRVDHLKYSGVIIYSEGRQPPNLGRCSVKIEGGGTDSSADSVLNVYFIEDDSIEMHCEVSGTPKPQLYWCKDVDRCNQSTDGARPLPAQYDGSLVVSPARRHHGGFYTLTAVNEYGWAFSYGIILHLAELRPFPAEEHARRYTVKAGSSARMECRYPAGLTDPALLVYSWNKVKHLSDPNPVLVQFSDRLILGTDGSLVVVFTTMEDKGFYLCQVSHRHLRHSVVGSPSELEVAGTHGVEFNHAPLILQTSHTITRVLVGQTVDLQCLIGGRPIPRIEWTMLNEKGGPAIIPSARFQMGSGNQTIRISNISSTDPREFSCTASNSEGIMKSVKLHLIIEDKPRSVELPTSQNVTVDDSVNLKCVAAGIPQPLVSWMINGNHLSALENEDIRYEIKAAGSELTLSELKRKNTFTVQCNATNPHGYLLHNAQILVTGPTRIIQGPSDVVLSGQPSVRFDCLIESDPSTTAAISWLKGTKQLDIDGFRLVLLSNQSLLLNTGLDEDGGLSMIGSYTCYVTNGLTETSRTARLRPQATMAETKDHPVIIWPFHVNSDMFWPLSIGFGCCLLMIIISVVIACRFMLTRRGKIIKTPSGSLLRKPESHEMKILRKWTEKSRISTSHPSLMVPDSRRFVDEPVMDGELIREALRDLLVPRSNLRMAHTIGRGQFGRVYGAFLTRRNERVEEHVAVKTMKYKPEETEMADLFLREAVLMKDFNHPHVLGVVGVTFDPDGSPMMILPFMYHGDMRTYIMNSDLDITVLRLLKMGLQVAHGMAYLTTMRFVHRDLAARNCMVDKVEIVKVADFGLSRELILRDYYRLSHNKTPVPVRWLAPECLESNVFTSRSDVWSFGVLLWELITRGAVPFCDIENWEVAKYVQSGKRLPQPIYCPDSIYQIMQNCWEENPLYRPTFEEIASDIQRVVDCALAPNLHQITSSSHMYTNSLPSSVAKAAKTATVAVSAEAVALANENNVINERNAQISLGPHYVGKIPVANVSMQSM